MTNMIKLDELFQTLESKDNNIRYEAFKNLLEITEQEEAGWIYEYWQTLVDKLSSENSFQRSIGLMLLANLSRSDNENKFADILERYLEFFNDEKFITSRQCLQNVWRIATNKQIYKNRIVDALKETYFKNTHLDRNPNLIKHDVVFSLKKISLFYGDTVLDEEITMLIAHETDKKTLKSLKEALAMA